MTPKQYCCEFMRQQLNYTCEKHDPCPRQVLRHAEDGRQILLVDGGGGFYECPFCPGCGAPTNHSTQTRSHGILLGELQRVRGTHARPAMLESVRRMTGETAQEWYRTLRALREELEARARRDARRIGVWR